MRWLVVSANPTDLAGVAVVSQNGGLDKKTVSGTMLEPGEHFSNRKMKMIKCVVTVTDTFGGEANYGWVKRYEFVPRNIESQRSVVRQAKALANMTAVKADTYDYGDSYTVKPRGYNQIIFVDFE